MALNFNWVRDNLSVKGNSKHEVIKLSLEQATLDGYILEFGVRNGKSANYIADLRPKSYIYGFDTFEGLPEDWVMSPRKTHKKGAFGLNKKGILPEHRKNATWIKGLFQDTLKDWRNKHPGIVSFIHIDSDTYSACKYVLSTLNDQLVPQTIILLDDLYSWGMEKEPKHYTNWKDGEWKALNEWIDEYDREVSPLYRPKDKVHMSASFKVNK